MKKATKMIETAIKPKYQIGQTVRVYAGICTITHIYYYNNGCLNPWIEYLCEFREVNYYPGKDHLNGGIPAGEAYWIANKKIFSVKYNESDIIERFIKPPF